MREICKHETNNRKYFCKSHVEIIVFATSPIEDLFFWKSTFESNLQQQKILFFNVSVDSTSKLLFLPFLKQKTSVFVEIFKSGCFVHFGLKDLF